MVVCGRVLSIANVLESNCSSVRTWGRVLSHNTSSCTFILSSGRTSVKVDTKLVEPAGCIQDTMVQVFGEVIDKENEPMIKARMVIPASGLDLVLFDRVAALREQYISTLEDLE